MWGIIGGRGGSKNGTIRNRCERQVLLALLRTRAEHNVNAKPEHSTAKRTLNIYSASLDESLSKDGTTVANITLGSFTIMHVVVFLHAHFPVRHINTRYQVPPFPEF